MEDGLRSRVLKFLGRITISLWDQGQCYEDGIFWWSMMGSTTATQHLYRTAFTAPSFQFFFCCTSKRSVVFCLGMEYVLVWRSERCILSALEDCIKKHRAAKFCANSLPNSGHTWLLYEHSTVLYAYILALGVKSRRLPFNVNWITMHRMMQSQLKSFTKSEMINILAGPCFI